MVRSTGRFVGLVSCVLLFASFCHAATITGTVKGPDGGPFKGAFVQAQNKNTKIAYIVLSSKDGQYRLENVPAGEYQLSLRAIGYKADPRTGVNLTAEQNASFDFSLQQGTVRWSDLSYYQGKQLFPPGKGHDEFVGICLGCHGFETRMAAVRRDADGWTDRVNYMRDITHFATWKGFTDQKAADIAEYINSIFGEGSAIPRSPTDLPKYKEVAPYPPYSDDATKIVFVEYEMPGINRFPWDANPNKDGTLWIPEFSPFNGIARLDPRTGEFQEYKALSVKPAFIHSAVGAPDGSAWFTEQSTNRLGKWDPKTNKVTEYQDTIDPALENKREGGSKHTLRVDSKGIVWSSGTPFSSFDPKTEKFTDYPEAAPNTYGIDIDKDDNVWFDGFTPAGKLFKIDARTHKITGYQPPTAGLPRRIQAAPDGIIWFAEFGAGKIGRFDPKTETFKEYPLPGAEPTPYALGIAKDGNVWFSSEQMDFIGCLDPKTGKITQYPFPHSENSLREFLPDSQGRMWYGSAPNNKVGYFYLASSK